MKIDSLVCENCEGGELGKPTSVGLQEFVDPFARYGHLSEAEVHGVDKKYHFRRNLPPVNSFERSDSLRNFVIQDSEILLLKTDHRWAGVLSNYYVQMDLAVDRKGWRVILPGGNLGGA